MHGRRANNRQGEEYKLEKIKELIPLVSNLIKNKRANIYNEENIEITSKILKKCPYLQTLWNYKKEYIEFVRAKYLERGNDDKEECIEEGTRLLKELIINDNILVENILNKFCKSNELWFHKLWLIKFGLKNNLIGLRDLFNELEYCKDCFYKDDRNYHCWNYRAYIISCIHIYIKKEQLERFKNCDSKKVHDNTNLSDTILLNHTFNIHKENYELSNFLIEHNFSNFSAWFLKYSIKDSLMNISDEIDLIKNAIFTDPYDQSLWEFYQWFFFKKGNHEEKVFFILLANNCFYIFFQNLIKINLPKCKCYDSKNNNEIKGTWNKQNITFYNVNHSSESYVYMFKINEGVELCNLTYLKFVLYYDKYNLHLIDTIQYDKSVLKDLINNNKCLSDQKKFEHSIVYEVDLSKILQDTNFKLLWSCGSGSGIGSGIGIGIGSGIGSGSGSGSGSLSCYNNIEYNSETDKTHHFIYQPNYTTPYTNFYKYITLTNIRLNTSDHVNLDILNSELEMINDLLCSEKDCKFALFTKLEILKRMENFDKLFEILEHLKSVDSNREGYYTDMEVELKIQKKISEYYKESETGNSNNILDLSYQHINDIIYPTMIEAFFIPQIDLSNNMISESYTGKFTVNFLYNLKELYLNNNKIQQFVILMKNLYNLKLLEKLDVSNNVLINLNEDLDTYDFVLLPLLNEINISDSNLSFLLNGKYIQKNNLNNYEVLRNNGKVILSR
ncbi:protein prenyltransferase alpha subunit, putative [Hepatocystis sp. ex Piliocolobus tephrosceles]|nr:protein prenyltransferase alpha subunit, putative [Hepatocystis sp. ex Piliocolobus tephrosceles]